VKLHQRHAREKGDTDTADLTNQGPSGQKGEKKKLQYNFLERGPLPIENSRERKKGDHGAVLTEPLEEKQKTI